MNRLDRKRYIEEDGSCRMCADGSWSREHLTCPVCDAELPDEDVYLPCSECGDEFPEGVLEDMTCPSCLDYDEDKDRGN